MHEKTDMETIKAKSLKVVVVGGKKGVVRKIYMEREMGKKTEREGGGRYAI